ncbi:uncharacterized protein I303_102639 [Kwoniella dejecticola CBS 10117]|uniref:Aminoglycoside phosphotransferase domain-containing protein n=1 Tax=Kwoniella dejecticola CBS 10117 TaxID=1296121 RepID=A0A1A6A9B2_9TREE|nr:uncharacterized protein I303_02653 [Kwoniella dejecticola CBS 10117]OBR86644.1 hypothetical protein I303_02653 [Kwoniella dejecticola CBS 10117]
MITSTTENWYEPEVSQVIAMLDIKLIKAEIEDLRKGGPRVKDIVIPQEWREFVFESGIAGSCNFHVKIVFEDGSRWVMRIRRRYAHRYSDQPLQLNLESEVATLRALHAAGIAVPNAWTRPMASKLHPKLIYCYQTWLPGEAFRADYRRIPFLKPTLDSATIRHIRGLAEWFIKMEKCTFDKVGSLTFAQKEHQEIVVGPLIERHPAYLEPPFYQEPFTTSKERWLAIIQKRMDFVLSREYCAPSWELKFYLALLDVKCLVNQCSEMNDPGPFYIKHDDDRFDHIRAKESGEVTGILDWEWAYTTNKQEAFAAPNGFVPPEYHEGKNDSLSDREIALINAYESLQRPDLAECVKNGRKYHRLVDLLRHNIINIGVINALERSFLNLPDTHTGQPSTMENWIDAKKEEYRSDKGLQTLLRMQSAR